MNIKNIINFFALAKILNFVIKYSIYALVFLMPLLWLPWTLDGLEFNKQYLLFFLTLLAFIAWLAKMIILEKRFIFIRGILDFFVLVFALIIILGSVFSLDKLSSWFGFYGRFSDSAIGLLSLILFYFVVVNGLAGSDSAVNDFDGNLAPIARKRILSLKTILLLFIISCFISLVVAILSLWGVWRSISVLPAVLKSGVFNPFVNGLNGLTIFLSALISFLVVLVLNQVRFDFSDGLPNNQKFIGLKKGLIYLLLVISFFLLWRINYSFGWLVLALVMFLLFILALRTGLLRQRINLLILPVLLLGISILGYFGVWGGVLTWLDIAPLPSELTLDFKTSRIIAVESIKERPILGSGPATYLIDFAKFKPESFNESPFWNVRFDRAPSHLMEVVSTAGTAGAVSYLALLVFVLIIISSQLILRSFANSPEEEKKKILDFLALAVVWLALLIGQVVYPQVMILNFSFWLFLALLSVYLNKIKTGFLKEWKFSFSHLPEIILLMNIILLVLSFVVLGLFYMAGRFYWAEVKYSQVINNTNQGRANIDDSIKILESAVNLNKFNANYHMALSQLYLNRAWLEINKPADQQDNQLLQLVIFGSVDQARLAAELEPNLVITWENLGAIYRDTRNLISGTLPFAFDSFNKASELEPTNPLFFRERCRINLLLQEQDWDKTMVFCQRAVALKPNYLDAQIQLAIAYEQKGNLNEALKTMEVALDKIKGVTFEKGSILAGAASEIYFQLGRLHYNLDRTAEAVKMFEQSVTITSDYTYARYGLALSYQKQNRLADALTQFEIINQLNPDIPEIIQSIQSIKSQLAR